MASRPRSHTAKTRVRSPVWSLQGIRQSGGFPASAPSLVVNATSLTRPKRFLRRGQMGVGVSSTGCQCSRRYTSPRSAINEPGDPGFPAEGTIAPTSFAPDISRWHHSGLERPVGKQVREQEEKPRA